jgi:2-polyprenyl-3-methyl-5-hydroxy-6-metoxy-1,4-benzoquinol methylase
VRDTDNKQPKTIAMATTTAARVLLDQCSISETVPACPLCCGTKFSPLSTPGHWIGKEIFSFRAGTFGLKRCQSCSLALVNPRPTIAILNSFYNSNNYACHRSGAGDMRTAQFLLECVAHHGPYQGRTFLDFGCGGGFLLRAASEENWTAVGYDIGQRALDECRKQGLTAISNLAELQSSECDVVLLNHVFEHLTDPEIVLSECRRLLNRTGKLFVIVPNLAGIRAKLSFPFLSRHFNVDERHRAFPIHLFYFTPRTLSRMLEKNGFRISAIETFGIGMSEFMNRPDRGKTRVSSTTSQTSTVEPRKSHALRQVIKQTFFKAGLGENLLAVAHSI